MNAVHPLTYHVVKAEEAHRLARLERRAMAQSNERAHGTHDEHQPQTVHTHRRWALPRAAGVAIATVALLLSIVAGAALANQPSGGGGGGGTRILAE